MLRIDAHLMFVAVARSADVAGLQTEIGYLNRTTGVIRFPRSANECDRLKNATDDWVEIPKHGRDDEDHTVFVRDFLLREGIDAEDLDR